jgi:hypothetical protein
MSKLFQNYFVGLLSLRISQFIEDKEVVQSAEIKEYWKISGYVAFC